MNYLVNPYIKRVVLEPQNVSIDDALKNTEESGAQAVAPHGTSHTEVMELLSFPMEGERSWKFGRWDLKPVSLAERPTASAGVDFFTELISEEANNKFRKEVK